LIAARSPKPSESLSAKIFSGPTIPGRSNNSGKTRQDPARLVREPIWNADRATIFPGGGRVPGVKRRVVVGETAAGWWHQARSSAGRSSIAATMARRDSAVAPGARFGLRRCRRASETIASRTRVYGDSLRHTPLNFLGKRAFRQCYPLLNPQALIQSASFDGTVRSGVTSIGGATVCSIMVP
jgi:hypothetical protein